MAEIVINGYGKVKEPSYFVGSDPDLHTFSVAILKDTDGLPVLERILLVKAKGSKGDAAVLDMVSALQGIQTINYLMMNRAVIAVESQDVSYTGRTNAARVSDLVNLAHIAGAVCQKLSVLAPRAMLLPKPQAWKGSVPKHIHQCRTLKRLGIEFDMAGGGSPYPVPRGLGGLVIGDRLNDGDWKDINDSIGLALYAWDWWRKGRG